MGKAKAMSDSGEKIAFSGADIGTAFSLLTRIPVPINHEEAGARAADAVWAYPLVGAALGACAAIIAHIALALGAPAAFAGALALASAAIVTGFMHEDGLADTADGLGGGQTPERRLEIMKDSRIGAFGATILGIALIARFAGLEALSVSGALFWTLVAVGAASRLPMVLVMAFVPRARPEGLSATVGAPPPKAVLGAIVSATTVCVIALGWSGFAVLFWALIAPWPLILYANLRIGGQTGDILGACQQIAEITALAVVVAYYAS